MMASFFGFCFYICLLSQTYYYFVSDVVYVSTLILLLLSSYILAPPCVDWKRTPSSVIFASFSKLTIWKPPLSVKMLRRQFCKKWIPSILFCTLWSSFILPFSIKKLLLFSVHIYWFEIGLLLLLTFLFDSHTTSELGKCVLCIFLRLVNSRNTYSPGRSARW